MEEEEWEEEEKEVGAKLGDSIIKIGKRITGGFRFTHLNSEEKKLSMFSKKKRTLLWKLSQISSQFITSFVQMIQIRLRHFFVKIYPHVFRNSPTPVPRFVLILPKNPGFFTPVLSYYFISRC